MCSATNPTLPREKCGPAARAQLMRLTQASPDFLKAPLKRGLPAATDGSPNPAPISARGLNREIYCAGGIRLREFANFCQAEDLGGAIGKFASRCLGEVGKEGKGSSQVGRCGGPIQGLPISEFPRRDDEVCMGVVVCEM